MKISRRDFLRKSSAATAAATISGGLVQNVLGAGEGITAGPGNKWPGRAVINFNKNALTGTTDVQNATIRKMVDDAILKLTDQTDVGAAWKSIFPSTLTATSKIAIKVPLGCASIPCFPHIAHVQGIINGLKLMDFGGTKFSGAVTIYDANCSPNLTNSSYGYTAANFPGVSIVFETSLSVFSDSADGRAYAKSLNTANFLINVFSPRGHSDFKVTLGFKNHFGTYLGSALHNGGIEAVNSSGAVYNKTVLNVCSAIYANLEGAGPGQSNTDYSVYVKTMDATATVKNPCTLILSTDPISADALAFTMMRVNNPSKGGHAVADMPSYLQNSAGLGSNIANIGVISPTDVRTINGATEVTVPKTRAGDIALHVSATHLTGHSSTFIQYSVPEATIGQNVSFEIFDIKGSLICKLSHRPMGSLAHFSWDERDSFNNLTKAGIYIVRLNAGSAQLSSQFTIMR